MKQDSIIYILLPAYNEEKVIKDLILDLDSLDMTKKIVLVDDGFTDNTVKNAESTDVKGLEIVKHEINKGLSCAIKTAINYFLDSASTEDYLVTMDAGYASG